MAPVASALAFRRAAGCSLLAAGLLGTLVPVLHPGHGPGYYTHPLTATSHLLLFAAALLASLGLPTLVEVAGGGRGVARVGAALWFVGEWCLDGSHGLIDGAVMPTLAAAQPKAAALLAGGHASQDLLAFGPLAVMTDLGAPAFIVGSLLLGLAAARARQVPRTVAWALALGWVLMPPSFVWTDLRPVAVALPYVALLVAGSAVLRAGGGPAVARDAAGEGAPGGTSIGMAPSRV
jgi:hypothetical protein